MAVKQTQIDFPHPGRIIAADSPGNSPICRVDMSATRHSRTRPVWSDRFVQPSPERTDAGIKTAAICEPASESQFRFLPCESLLAAASWFKGSPGLVSARHTRYEWLAAPPRGQGSGLSDSNHI